MNQGQYEKTKGGKEDNGNDDSDVEAESSDDDYKFTFLQHDMTCSIQDKAAIPKTWILLDSQSNVDVFSNPKLLMNICDAKISLTLYFNAGMAIINKKGDLKGYGTVWFYPDRIVNILSLENVKKQTQGDVRQYSR